MTHLSCLNKDTIGQCYVHVSQCIKQICQYMFYNVPVTQTSFVCIDTYWLGLWFIALEFQAISDTKSISDFIMLVYKTSEMTT